MGILKWWLIKGGRALSLLDSEAGFLGWGAYRLMEKTSLYKTM